MVYIFFAEGTEELEFVTTADVLRRADIDVATVSAVPKTKEVTGAHGIKLVLDKSIDEIAGEECDMVILPGGMPGTTNLLESEDIKELILSLEEEGKPLAAICEAPLVFAAHGILRGRKATIFPGFEDRLKDGAAEAADERVVVDGNIITGQGPGTALEFALAVIEMLKGKSEADKVKKQMLIK